MIEFFPSRTVAVAVGGFSIHWYGLLYLTSFLLAYALVPVLQRERGLRLTRDQWASVLSSVIVGVIVGGRMGYVIFYEPHWIIDDPLEVFRVWHGGMSSHGGLIGVVLALLFESRRKKIPPLVLGDIAVVPAAIGLALGRLGNFINLELYGMVTDLPWGIAIPGVEGLRHPTQIYAMCKDLVIAAVCLWHLHCIRSVRPGRTFALFLMLYGVLRFLVEFLRVPSHTPFDIGMVTLTRGQFFTIPVFIAGVVLWIATKRTTKR